jgi:hypothetical protein
VVTNASTAQAKLTRRQDGFFDRNILSIILAKAGGAWALASFAAQVRQGESLNLLAREKSGADGLILSGDDLNRLDVVSQQLVQSLVLHSARHRHLDSHERDILDCFAGTHQHLPGLLPVEGPRIVGAATVRERWILRGTALYRSLLCAGGVDGRTIFMIGRERSPGHEENCPLSCAKSPSCLNPV